MSYPISYGLQLNHIIDVMDFVEINEGLVPVLSLTFLLVARGESRSDGCEDQGCRMEAAAKKRGCKLVTERFLEPSSVSS